MVDTWVKEHPGERKVSKRKKIKEKVEKPIRKGEGEGQWENWRERKKKKKEKRNEKEKKKEWNEKKKKEIGRKSIIVYWVCNPQTLRSFLPMHIKPEFVQALSQCPSGLRDHSAVSHWLHCTHLPLWDHTQSCLNLEPEMTLPPLPPPPHPPLLPTNLFSWSLNVTFLLILFFLGNFLRNTSAKISGSIPSNGWVVFFSFFFFSSLILFFLSSPTPKCLSSFFSLFHIYFPSFFISLFCAYFFLQGAHLPACVGRWVHACVCVSMYEHILDVCMYYIYI